MTGSDLHVYCASNEKKIHELAGRFGDYQPLRGGSRERLVAWLGQFNAQHRDLAVKLAGKIEYYGTHRITENAVALRGLVDQEIKAVDVASGDVLYVAGGRTGESGDEVLRRYRNANQLHSRRDRFIEVHRLTEALFAISNPGVVFLDDFIGTGKQISDYWRDVLCQIVPDYVPLYLAVIAGFRDGIRKVEDSTPLKVITVHTLDGRHQLLAGANTAFNSAQKTTLKRYCEDWGNHPLGFGDLGALVSFAHGTPNNAPSVIRGSEKQTPQRGLLPGWEDLD
jgi:hypothetical protein